MQLHTVTVDGEGQMARTDELAWRLAEVATDPVAVDPEVAALVADRLIDNAGVAVAALGRAPVRAARAQALAHPRDGGATLFGLPRSMRFHCEWAAIANATAVRELDYHDNVFEAEMGHSGDMIPALVAVAQQMNLSGADLLRAVSTAYEVHVALCRGIELHAHGIDHVGHLAPAIAAGLCAALRLDQETAYQAIQQAAHTGYSPGQTRKGAISSWKAYAPGHVSLLAINAVDRAMRGEDSPSPTYEGEQGVIVGMLGGKDATLTVSLPEAGEPRRLALDTFTKEHSCGYHGQAAVDLGLRLHGRIKDKSAIRSIVYHTKRRTHIAMGSGSGSAHKYDPEASRETLDHSLMYVMAIAIEDGRFHHDNSYLPERARRPETVALWRKISTADSPEWNERYVGRTGLAKDHGGRAVVTLEGGEEIIEEIAVPNGHPRGERPLKGERCISKFETLVAPLTAEAERQRFLEALAQLGSLPAGALDALNLEAVKVEEGSARNGIY